MELPHPPRTPLSVTVDAITSQRLRKHHCLELNEGFLTQTRMHKPLTIMIEVNHQPLSPLPGQKPQPLALLAYRRHSCHSREPRVLEVMCQEPRPQKRLLHLCPPGIFHIVFSSFCLPSLSKGQGILLPSYATSKEELPSQVTSQSTPIHQVLLWAPQAQCFRTTFPDMRLKSAWYTAKTSRTKTIGFWRYSEHVTHKYLAHLGKSEDSSEGSLPAFHPSLLL